MKKTILSFVIMLGAANVQARVHTYASKGDPAGVEKTLRAAGFSVIRTECNATSCNLYMPDSETKDPAPTIAAFAAVDQAALMATARNQAIALAKKLKAGTISDAEKDALLLRLCFLLLSQDQD